MKYNFFVIIIILYIHTHDTIYIRWHFGRLNETRCFWGFNHSLSSNRRGWVVKNRKEIGNWQMCHVARENVYTMTIIGKKRAADGHAKRIQSATRKKNGAAPRIHTRLAIRSGLVHNAGYKNIGVWIVIYKIKTKCYIYIKKKNQPINTTFAATDGTNFTITRN